MTYHDRLMAELAKPAMRRLSLGARMLWQMAALKAGPNGAVLPMQHGDDLAKLVDRPADEIGPLLSELQVAGLATWQEGGLSILRPRGVR